ncbi:uncharacterized protein LOC117101646 isoform X2 [Anneissia japonica]|nr:uncharacterized protein LOC117101646 isoform X2 [Anneissia japonica]XP_033097748.1 uncharacterized protein LOC117101646 isoform X2 [Anneissia japonica]
MTRALCVLLCLSMAFMTCQGKNSSGEDPCDFIIVGAGTTSLSLAGKLAEVPHWKICVFERGPEEYGMSEWYTGSYKFTTPHDPFWLTQPALGTNIGSSSKPYNKIKDARHIYIPRFRGRGGTSRVYGAIARRASPAVLNLWPDGWKHDQFSKYYKQIEDHYCHYDSVEATGISPEDCEEWHGKGGAMQLNSQIEEAFRKFPREMKYLCEDETKPWKGYAADYNGPKEDRISCSVFQQYKLRIENKHPTEAARRNRTSKTGRGSSYTGYYQYTENKPYMYTSSTVTKILFENGKAVGVAYLDVNTNSVRTRLAKKEVIVGAGSFDTPHLLQVSGVGPRDLLKKIGVDEVADNQHVGQHLWDHISVPYVLKLRSDSDSFCCMTNETDVPTVNIDGTIHKTEDLDRINGPFSWIIHYRSNIERTPQEMSDIQLYVMGNSKLFDEVGPLCTSDTPHSGQNEYSYQGEFLQEENTNDDSPNEGTIRIIDQWPEYRGSINATTPNIFDKPRLEYGWNYTLNGEPSPEFQKVSQLVRDQVRLLRDMFFGENVRPSLGELVLDEVTPGLNLKTDEELDAWMRGMLVSALHPVGTCKMPECVDEFLQVRGVSNLRVCDASAFATQIDGNPSATLFAMAEKLAEMLKFQHLKYINVAVRNELSISVHEDIPMIPSTAIKEMIQSTTKCIDTTVSVKWQPTGKGSSAIIINVSLICSERFNERDIADQVAEKTLSLIADGCGVQDYPPFDRAEATLPSDRPTPKHRASPYVFIVWCQSFKNVSPDKLWENAGKWNGDNGRQPGSTNRFKLNCQPEATSILKYVNDTARELIYVEPELPLPVTNYISTKKVVTRESGSSSVFFRTGSMISDSDESWYDVASYLLEDVYQSSGRRLSRQYPPLSNQVGWWTELSDGLLYYETTGIRTNEQVASFDLDGTIIKTKSGNTFPEDENDWIFTSSNVKSIIQLNNKDHINNVIMSNQNGIGTGSQDKEEWMDKIEKITAELGVPMYVLAATEKNKYRKPNVGMWDYYSCTLNQFKTIDKDKSIYVGDAAGRPDDFSDSDKKFAENIGIAFKNNDEYFEPGNGHSEL